VIPWLFAATALALSPEHLAEVAEVAGMEVAEVEAALSGLEPSEEVLERIRTPWESKPWHQYHPILLTEERVAKGKAFMEAHTATLARAEETYGVSAEVITAILGVETTYGERQGEYPVLVALYTLGFHYPRRGAFFRKELGHYLRLGADEGWAVQRPLGSYAGAMGIGQFIPSSYRRWAVDFDGDGTRDLFGSVEDAVGSVAFYLHDHGWRSDELILVEARVEGPADDLIDRKLALRWTVAELAEHGVTVDPPLPADAKARLFAFAVPEGTEYRVGLHDFYVITRYNHSPLYARVVVELSKRLAAGTSTTTE
jgi:membrane-bound lytic murein transglycosylase B